MKVLDAVSIGQQVRAVRKAQKLTQPDLALIANVGVRFIVDLEKGKKTCQLGLAVGVMSALGIDIELLLPPVHCMDAPQDLVVDLDTDGGFKP